MLVLTETEAKITLRALEQREGVDLFTAPSVTTVTGKMARLALENQPPPVFDPPFTAPGKDAKAHWSTAE